MNRLGETARSTTLVQSSRPPIPVSQHTTCRRGGVSSASRWPRRANSTRAAMVMNSKAVRKRCGVLSASRHGGWLIVFITGIWYRLFAFLIWLHFHRGRGEGPVRTAAELVHRGMAWTALVLLGGGALLLAGGTAAGSLATVVTASWSVLGGSLLILVQYGRIFSAR